MSNNIQEACLPLESQFDAKKLNGSWPTNTWFQRRLAELKLKEAKEVLNASNELSRS